MLYGIQVNTLECLECNAVLLHSTCSIQAQRASEYATIYVHTLVQVHAVRVQRVKCVESTYGKSMLSGHPSSSNFHRVPIHFNRLPIQLYKTDELHRGFLFTVRSAAKTLLLCPAR